MSEAMLDTVRTNPKMTIIGEAEDWAFDRDGNLEDL